MRPLFSFFDRSAQQFARIQDYSGLLSALGALAMTVWAYFFEGARNIPPVYLLFVCLGVFAFSLYILMAFFQGLKDYRLKDKLAPLGVEIWGEKRGDDWYIGFVPTIRNLYGEPMRLAVKSCNVNIESRTSDPDEEMHVSPVIPANADARLFTQPVKIELGKKHMRGKMDLRLEYGPESGPRHVMSCAYAIYVPSEFHGDTVVSEGMRYELRRLEYSIA